MLFIVDLDVLYFFPYGPVVFHLGQVHPLDSVHIEVDSFDCLEAGCFLQAEREAIDAIGAVQFHDYRAIREFLVGFDLIPTQGLARGRLRLETLRARLHLKDVAVGARWRLLRAGRGHRNYWFSAHLQRLAIHVLLMLLLLVLNVCVVGNLLHGAGVLSL